MLDIETAARLLSLPGRAGPEPLLPAPERLELVAQQRQAEIQRVVSVRNANYFEAEAGKLDGWADDLKVGLGREIKELDRQIKDARRAATIAATLEEKLAGFKQVKALELRRTDKRRGLFEAQDDIDRQRDALIASIEGKMRQRSVVEPLFSIRWNLA